MIAENSKQYGPADGMEALNRDQTKPFAPGGTDRPVMVRRTIKFGS
jgi:hypothetical protein